MQPVIVHTSLCDPALRIAAAIVIELQPLGAEPYIPGIDPDLS